MVSGSVPTTKLPLGWRQRTETNRTSKKPAVSGSIAPILAHLAFGGGPHVCPGASLARLEARVAVEVFLDNVASVTPVRAGRYDPIGVTWAHGPQSLDVQMVPARK